MLINPSESLEALNKNLLPYDFFCQGIQNAIKPFEGKRVTKRVLDQLYKAVANYLEKTRGSSDGVEGSFTITIDEGQVNVSPTNLSFFVGVNVSFEAQDE